MSPMLLDFIVVELFGFLAGGAENMPFVPLCCKSSSAWLVSQPYLVDRASC